MLFDSESFTDKVDWSSLPDEETISVVRAARNHLLSESDWTQLPDAPLTETKRAEWATYRQALRDITETYSNNLLEAEFPRKP
jgi:hypothetical protein